MFVPSHLKFTTQCINCQKDVPATNFELHSSHCLRNLDRCNLCNEMVPRSNKNQHYQERHAPVSCPLCGQAAELGEMNERVNQKCIQRTAYLSLLCICISYGGI